MKKTRLISMLLSAAMLVSSLPFAAAMTTAASASPAVEIELGTDLLDGVSFTADVNTLDITSEVGEGYLHLYNTPAATSGEWKTGIGYKTDGVTFKKDTAYGIKFDMRLAFGPVASNKEGTDRSKNSAVDPTLYFTCVSSMTLTDILLKSGTSTSFAAYAPTPQGKVTDEAKTSYYVPTAGADVTMNTAWAGNGLYNVYPNVYKTGTLPGYMTDWSTYSYVFVPTADVVDPQIAIVSRPTRSTVPIDIDNFSIVEYKQDGTSTVVETISFDNANAASLIAADANDLSGKFFPASGTAGAANFDSGKLKVEIGTQYTKLVAPTGAATVNYDFDDGVTLSAGEYELSGEARLNYFSNVWKSNFKLN